MIFRNRGSVKGNSTDETDAKHEVHEILEIFIGMTGRDLASSNRNTAKQNYSYVRNYIWNGACVVMNDDRIKEVFRHMNIYERLAFLYCVGIRFNRVSQSQVLDPVEPTLTDLKLIGEYEGPIKKMYGEVSRLAGELIKAYNKKRNDKNGVFERHDKRINGMGYLQYLFTVYGDIELQSDYQGVVNREYDENEVIDLLVQDYVPLRVDEPEQLRLPGL